MPCSAIPSRNPRLVITVTTTVSCDEQAPVVTIDGGDADDLVTVDQPADGVHCESPIAVAVERDADGRAGLDDGSLEVTRVGRAAARVDVGAIGFGVQDGEVGAQRPQHVRARSR